jgi:hypothetical protein
MAAKGFIAQVGIKGYNAHLTIINLLVTHTDKVTAPLSINPHNFLILTFSVQNRPNSPNCPVSHTSEARWPPEMHAVLVMKT